MVCSAGSEGARGPSHIEMDVYEDRGGIDVAERAAVPAGVQVEMRPPATRAEVMLLVRSDPCGRCGWEPAHGGGVGVTVC